MSEAAAKTNPADYDRAMKLGGAIRRYRDLSKAEKERADAAEKRLADLTAENESLKTRADTSLSSKRVEELTAELRSIKHRQSFDKLATAKGANPAGLDDLWQLSGYKPESDAIDEASLGLLIDEQKGKRGYLFGEPKPADEATETPPPLKPAVGSGQGGANGGIQKFTQEQLSDASFVMRNYDAVSSAAAARVAAGQV